MSVKVVNLSLFDEKLVDLMMSQIGIMIFYFPMLLLLRERRETEREGANNIKSYH